MEGLATRALGLGNNSNATILAVFVIRVLCRRICLGRRMANTALFINIASILWAANISPVMDDTGKPIIPDTLETVNSAVVM